MLYNIFVTIFWLFLNNRFNIFWFFFAPYYSWKITIYSTLFHKAFQFYAILDNKIFVPDVTGYNSMPHKTFSILNTMIDPFW